MGIYKNTALGHVYFVSRNADGTANSDTSKVPLVEISRDGGPPVAAASAPSHLARGLWVVPGLLAGEMDGNAVCILTSGAGLMAESQTIYPESHYTTDLASSLGSLAQLIANLPLAVWNVLTVSLLQVGSFGAFLNEVLDQPISSRLALDDYTAPDNDGIAVAVAAGVAWQESSSVSGSLSSVNTSGTAVLPGMLVAVRFGGGTHWRTVLTFDAQTRVATFAPVVTPEPPALTQTEVTIYRDAAPITDYQQRNVAVTLPDPAPDGYGSTGGSGSVTIRQVHHVTDRSPLLSLPTIKLTAGDTASSVSLDLVDADGDPVPLAGEETTTFTMKLIGGESAAISAAAATLTAPDRTGLRAALFAFGGANPLPAAGEYEATFKVAGTTYPVNNRRMRVSIAGAL